jgi:hypothetical protein
VNRLERLALLEMLGQRVTQFRRYEDISPFRRPHEPLDLSRLVRSALQSGSHISIADAVDALRSRTVIEMHWSGSDRWVAWAATLPSGIHVYCDSVPSEHRVLASVKRGSATEADRFFLELLAESRGDCFGIEMAGGAPVRIRTPIDDRDLLTDVFVELLEGTEAEAQIGSGSGDFRVDVAGWLADVLEGPATSARPRRYPRLRDELLDS